MTDSTTLTKAGGGLRRRGRGPGLPMQPGGMTASSPLNQHHR